MDEIISLIVTEISLHKTREKLEETIAATLLARHNAMFTRRQRVIVLLQPKVE